MPNSERMGAFATPSRTRSGPNSERMGAFSTPSRTRSGNRLPSAPTPRQAAIAAKKAFEEEKKRQAMVIKQQREELKAAAKAKQEEIMAQQQLSLKKRAQTAQRQREAAAAARKAARERQMAAQAKELQASMKENRELRERMLKEDKERRRNSLAHRNAAWCRERDLKKRLQKERQEEQKMIMEAHAVFLEAKDRLKKEQALAHRQELIWRARNKECRRQERESRDGRRRTYCDEEIEIWGRELDRQMGLEEGTTHRLYRQDCEEYERCLSELKKEDQEFKRMELMRYRLFKQQEELKRKEQEAKERSILLEDRESVLESKKKEEEAELDRREALREVPLETRKIDIVEALWARQTQTPVDATRGRRRLQLHSVQELGTPETSVEANASMESALLRSVQEVDTGESNAEANASLESGAASEVYIDVGGEFDIGYSDCSIVSSSASNMGTSNWDEGKKNLRLEVPERDLDMEAIYCTAGLSSGPSWSESSVFEARGVTAEAAEVLAAAEQSFSSSESLDEAGANAVASVAICSPVANSLDKSRFPVRALVFPSSPVGDCVKEAKEEEGIRGLLLEEGDHDETTVSAGERCSELKEGIKAGDMNLCSSGDNKENSSRAAGAQGEAAESSNDETVAMMPLTVDMVASLDRGDGISCPTAPSPTGSDNGDEEEVNVG